MSITIYMPALSPTMEMGNIVFEDMKLISKNLNPRFCKKALRKTVHLLRSKPVAIN